MQGPGRERGNRIDDDEWLFGINNRTFPLGILGSNATADRFPTRFPAKRYVIWAEAIVGSGHLILVVHL